MSAHPALGVDPGLNGAIALYDGARVHVWDMPTVHVARNGKNKREVSPLMLAYLLREADMLAEQKAPDGVLRAYVEKVGAMPGQGVTSMFSFGRSLGLVEGILAGMTVPTELVLPSAWRKAMNVRGGKDGSRLRAQELLPAQAGLFARVKDDGRAEAALMAILCYQRNVQ